jgi:UDP-N-acetylglucosamine 2-epimerase
VSGPIALFFGTRPQVIKASVVREALAAVGAVVAVDTGQHYDYKLHQVHYDQLGVCPPDAFLDVGSGSHATQTAAILTACERWLVAHRPRGAVVIGDTNSTLACALAATKLRVPVAHVEAGLRAADRLMAEEINRRLVDSIASLLFAPCERVAATLRRQYPDAGVEFAGDVAYDVLRRALPRLPRLDAVPGYDSAWGERFVYVTLHRAELVDVRDRLALVVEALGSSPLPCLFAAHPRAATALEQLGVAANGRVRVTAPVGYLESVVLAKHAAAVVTDSGGLQREAYWLGVPCVTVRQETEWLETVERGANRLVPPEDAKALPDVIAKVVNGRDGSWDRTAYGEGHSAKRIAETIAQTF